MTYEEFLQMPILPIPLMTEEIREFEKRRNRERGDLLSQLPSDWFKVFKDDVPVKEWTNEFYTP